MARSLAKLGFELGPVDDRMQTVVRAAKGWRDNPEYLEALHEHQKANGLKGYVIDGEPIATWHVRGVYAVRAARGVSRDQLEETAPNAGTTTAPAGSAMEQVAQLRAARDQLISKLESEITDLERQIEERRSALKELRGS